MKRVSLLCLLLIAPPSIAQNPPVVPATPEPVPAPALPSPNMPLRNSAAPQFATPPPIPARNFPPGVSPSGFPPGVNPNAGANPIPGVNGTPVPGRLPSTQPPPPSMPALPQRILPPSAAGVSNPPGVPLPGNTPVIPSGPNTPAGAAAAAMPPAGPGVAAVDPGSEMVPRMEFINEDMKNILSTYEQLTGKQLIYENSSLAPGGQMNIIIEQPVPKAEAIKIIEKTLLMNGVYLVPVEHTNLVNVFGLAKVPQVAGVPILEDETEIPENDVVVSFLLHLQNADPQDVVQSITAVLGQSAFSQVLALPKASAVLLTDATPRLRTMLKLARAVDQRGVPVVAEFISLYRADSKDVLERLEKLFEKGNQPTQTTAPGTARTLAPGAPPATTPEGTPIPPTATAVNTGPNSVEITGGGLTEDSLIVGKIKLTADQRTNRIFVVTREVNMPFVRKLIREFDQDVRFGEPTVRPLRFVSAGDILPTIVKSIEEPGQKEEGGEGGGASQNRNNQNNRSGSTGSSSLFGGNTTNGLNGTSGGAGGLGSGSSTGGASLTESLDTGERDTVPETRIVGTTKIIADKRANSIIVLGNEDRKAKVLAIIDELDVRAPQVRLNTVIGELTLDKNEEFGVKYLLQKGLSNAGAAAALASNNTGATGTTTTTGATTTSTTTGSTTTLGNALGPGFTFPGSNTPGLSLAGLLSNPEVTQAVVGGAGGLTGFITAGNAFNALISALDSTSRFHVVSRPSIFTSNNKKAIITSGQRIPIPTNTVAGFTGASNNLTTSSSIEYEDVQLQLEVLPLINNDREVYLDIVQRLDEPGANVNISGNQIPQINSQALKTSVTVPNRGTLVLGGLIKVTKSRTISGVPVLDKIPVLGALFRSTADTKMRSELVIIIHPEVTWSPREATKNSEKETEFLKLEPDLESTLYPKNLHTTEPTPGAPLRGSAIRLRDSEK